MKRNTALVLMCVILLACGMPAIAESMYVVTTHPDESIYMYTEPDYNAGQIIIAVPSGAEVAVRTVMADVPWIEASYGGYTGYIALESLSDTPPGGYVVPVIPSGPVIKTMYVTSHNGEGVHMRTAPTINDDGNIIMTVPYGATVGVITIMADVPWATIEYNGNVGYMMMDYLSNHQPEPKEPISSSSGSSGGEENETSLDRMFDGFQKSGFSATVHPAEGETYVNMRWAPTLAAPVRTTYGENATLWVSDDNGTWSEVYDEAQDIHGFMESRFLQR